MKKQILSYLPDAHPWKNSIVCFDTLDSTNNHAKALASAGAPHGTVIIADSQSAGRGRLGRSFCSPAGCGIYMSVILRPCCSPSELLHLTCAVAVAACDAIEDTLAFRPGVKWINDLVWDAKKLGGILTELSIDTRSGLVDYAIVGIGINCSQKAEDFPPALRSIACSAAMATGSRIDRSRLAAAMIRQLEQMADRLSHRSAIMERYRQDCITIGKDITVIQGDRQQHARALSVNDDGALVVDGGNGQPSIVNCGEVSVRGLFGYV